MRSEYGYDLGHSVRFTTSFTSFTTSGEAMRSEYGYDLGRSVCFTTGFTTSEEMCAASVATI
jgi:hypothetical protein